MLEQFGEGSAVGQRRQVFNGLETDDLQEAQRGAEQARMAGVS
jgi:hypothetical protein